MSNTWYTKMADNAAALVATLRDADGTKAVLTASTVLLVVIQNGTRRTDSVTLTDAANGLVTVTPAAFTVAGEWQAWFQVTYSGGTVQSFPVEDDFTITVSDDGT